MLLYEKLPAVQVSAARSKESWKMIKLRCTNCKNSLEISLTTNRNASITCPNCNAIFERKENFIDALRDSDIGPIERQAIKTWGDDLHSQNQSPATSHLNTLNGYLSNRLDNWHGKILEVGCGSGSDSIFFTETANADLLASVDIGRNIYSLAEINMNNFYARASCLNLPFESDQFDFIYSYGVIHHTSRPDLAISEIARVCKPGAEVAFYVYSSHTNNLLKRLGVAAESSLMAFHRIQSEAAKRLNILFFATLSWILFTLTSKLISRIGLKKIARKFPFHWGGMTPLSIVPDIKDRLNAPINHRYSKTSINKIIIAHGLRPEAIVENHSGVYIYATKLD